jgi:hypothetical protein
VATVCSSRCTEEPCAGRAVTLATCDVCIGYACNHDMGLPDALPDVPLRGRLAEAQALSWPFEARAHCPTIEQGFV